MFVVGDPLGGWAVWAPFCWETVPAVGPRGVVVRSLCPGCSRRRRWTVAAGRLGPAPIGPRFALRRRVAWWHLAARGGFPRCRIWPLRYALAGILASTWRGCGGSLRAVRPTPWPGARRLLSGLLRWRTGPAHAARIDSHPRRVAAASLVAAAVGVAIDRSQVGQFPIIATVRAGRSTSGLDYLVYLPDGYYRSLERWPLILTLHGRGEAGLDIGLVRRQGLPLRIEEKGGLPFVIVAPLSSDWAWNVEALDALLDEVLKRYRVDLDRIYVTGNSMGGNGTWALAANCPERFAAIAPICGVGDASTTACLKHVPTLGFSRGR